MFKENIQSRKVNYMINNTYLPFCKYNSHLSPSVHVYVYSHVLLAIMAMTMTPTTNALTVTSVFYDGIFQAVNL